MSYFCLTSKPVTLTGFFMAKIHIDVATQAKLNVPEGYEFIPKAQANSLMQAMG